MTQFGYPYRIDGRGRTASATDEAHVRELIEQLLFTVPGERVNRPEFGTGLMQLVFAPNSVELASATQFLVAGALQRFLGHLIKVDDVEVQATDGTLNVQVTYVLRRTEERRVEQFTREA